MLPLDLTLIEGLDALDPATRILDQSRIGPVLTGDRRDLGDGPPVTALFVQNTNPMVVAPESGLVQRGFARDDLFVCVHEQFMTETAAMADIVLPATTFLEHDDIYTAGGHTFLQIGRAVLPPYAECRSNHEVICGLAKRLGAPPSRLRDDRVELIEATLQGQRAAGRRSVRGRGLARLLARLRDRAFPRRLRPSRQASSISAPTGRRSAPSTRCCRHFPTMSR